MGGFIMVFKNLKKVICVAFLLTMLSVPTLVYAASYSTTFDFIVSVEGSSRSFSKGNINPKR